MVQLFVGGAHPTIDSGQRRDHGRRIPYQIEPIGDVDADGFDDALIVLPGASYALYRGAATLPTTVAMTWTDATASSAAGGFDLDRDGFSDFVVGTTAFTSDPLPWRRRRSRASVASGLSRLTSSSDRRVFGPRWRRPARLRRRGQLERRLRRFNGRAATEPPNPRSFMRPPPGRRDVQRSSSYAEFDSRSVAADR